MTVNEVEERAREARDGSGAAQEAPRVALAGRSLVRAALAFYGALFGAALIWAQLSGEPLLYATDEAQRRGLAPLRDVAAGLLAGVVAVAISRELTRRTRWGTRLARSLAAVLGPLTPARCLLLAAVSGLAEEAFFRGALQPRLGLVATSLLFGLAHFVPRRAFLPWTATAVAAGFLLGWLFEVTGNLVAPVVAHATVNAANLHWLASHYGRRSQL